MHQEYISLKCQQSGLSDGNNSLSFAGLTKKRPRSASSATGLSRILNISPKYLRTKAHKKTSPHSQQSYHTSPYPLPPKKVFCSLERQQFLRSQAEDNSCLQNKISKPLTLLEECDTQPQSYTATATTFSSPVSVSHDGDGHFNTDSFSYTAHESRTFMHSREHNSIDIHLEQQQLITPGDNSYLAQTQSLNEKADSNKCLDECKNSGSEKEAEIKCDESDCWIVPSPETYCDVSPDVTNRTESDTKSSPASDESLFQNQYSYSDWNLESTVRKKKTSSLSSGSYLSSVSSPPSPHSSDAESAANINHTKPNRLLLLDAIQSSIFRQKYFPVPDKKICLESSLLSKVLPQLKEKDLDNSQEYGLQALLKGNTSEEKISSQNTAHSVEDESSVICEKETEQKSDKVSKDLNAECKSTSNEVKVKKECFLSSSLLTDGKCQVCGDVAAGFYCGAFICEACKKFFVRTCKQGKVKYICHRNKKCIITKENRIRCQYCRYQKCLSVNMYSPADQPAGTKSDINNIPCRVCGGPSSGFHFGALTCEGCKGFFRRMAKERQPNTYRCPKEGSCSINTFTRNICKACRYKKCTDVGMCLEGSRIGRQPNSIKHALSLEAKKIKPESDISVTQNCEVKPVLVKKYTESENKETEEIPVDVQQADVKQEPIFFPDDIKTSLKDAMKTFSDLRMDKFTSDISKLSTMEGAWEEMMNHLEISAKCTIMFAKHVPGFKTLLMSDQIVLMQLATYPISLLNFARHYDLDKGDNACLGFSRAQEKMLIKFFPSLDILPAHHRHIGFMMKHLCIDDQELAIMCAVILFCDDCEILKENWKVKKWHDYFVECLQQHIQMSYRDSNTRFGALLLRLGELAVNSLQQNKTIMSIITSHPHLQVNRLFKEIFAV